MNLIRNDQSLPIYFTILRNIVEIDRTALEADDFIFGFDIKGQQARQVLQTPRDILNYEYVALNTEMFSKTLKGQDFLQSFKKLDLN